MFPCVQTKAMNAFQALFHHIFQQIIPHLGNEILTSGQYAVEFEPQGVFLQLYVRFWKGAVCAEFIWLGQDDPQDSVC